MEDKAKIDNAVQEILGNPVFIGFSDYVYKLRRNLVALSFAVLAYKISGVQIITNDKCGITLLGIPLSRISHDFIDVGLTFYLLYSLVHFSTESLETYLRWKIRLTGTYALFQRGFSLTAGKVWTIGLSDVGYDYENQSSLHSVLKQVIEHSKHALEGKHESQIDAKQNAILNILRIVEASLDRFENGFKAFQWFQILRFAVLDLGFPVIISLIALYSVSPYNIVNKISVFIFR